MNTNRRRFLRALAGSTLALPLAAADTARRKFTLGIIADVHKDIIHDADERLTTFVDEMKKLRADAILQLGDFCIPKPPNQGFVDIFNSFGGPRYHVIGNHDMDGGFSREQTVEFWGMKSRYYSFDQGGFHFVVLDANHRPEGWKGGYPSHIDEEQVGWLERDLASTNLNTFVFSHQSLERPTCIGNQEEVRAVLEAARTEGGKRKVAACLNGHWHIDHQREINGIPYIHINSAAYLWVGKKLRKDRLPAKLAKRFPTVASTIPYTEPLFTHLTIDPEAGSFTLAARESAWMGPGPRETGVPEDKGAGPESIQPRIRARSGSIPS